MESLMPPGDCFIEKLIDKLDDAVDSLGLLDGGGYDDDGYNY
jgi:hypothetical protein